LTEADREALEFCLERVLGDNSDPGRVEQVKNLVRDCGWRTAAIFCSALLQRRALGLNRKPWCSVPAYGDTQSQAEGVEIAAARRKLMRDMAARGISRFVADPIAALAMVAA
jgi:hypothetical protein